MAYESLIGNWSDGNQFYDMRKKYMLQRVDDAYNDRNVNSKIDSSTTEYKSKVDLEKLGDVSPKTGKAVSLLGSSNTVTDELVNSLEAVAKQDTMKSGLGNNDSDAKGLTNVRSLLGRADGVSPNVDTIYEDAHDENGNTIYQPVMLGEGTTPVKVAKQVYDFALSAGEKANLKSQSVQSLLDKFFEVDTSKY